MKKVLSEITFVYLLSSIKAAVLNSRNKPNFGWSTTLWMMWKDLKVVLKLKLALQSYLYLFPSVTDIKTISYLEKIFINFYSPEFIFPIVRAWLYLQ